MIYVLARHERRVHIHTFGSSECGKIQSNICMNLPWKLIWREGGVTVFILLTYITLHNRIRTDSMCDYRSEREDAEPFCFSVIIMNDFDSFRKYADFMH